MERIECVGPDGRTALLTRTQLDGAYTARGWVPADQTKPPPPDDLDEFDETGV